MARVIDEHQQRRRALAARFDSLKADALLLTGRTDVRYLTGFTGSNGWLLLTADGKGLLLTDPRYTVQARQETNCRVRIVKGSKMLTALVEAVGASRIRRLGLDGGQVTWQMHEGLREALPMRVELVHTPGAVAQQRMIKSPAEVTLIREAVRTNSRAFEAAIGRFRPGMTENELAGELDYQMRRHGAEGVCFETIVASGARAALPHARPGRAKIMANQLLLIDMGASQAGYASDMTRTVAVGRVPRVQREAYAAVLDAQQAALECVRPGVRLAEADVTARRVLRRAGLDRFFVHSLGHGLGLDVHEAPRLARTEGGTFSPGMVVTIEPGIYLENEFGIRIEDTVLVTETGHEVLTPTTKAYTAIP